MEKRLMLVRYLRWEEVRMCSYEELGLVSSVVMELLGMLIAMVVR